METWDEEKLRDVVDQNSTKQQMTTDVGTLPKVQLNSADEGRLFASSSFRQSRIRSTGGCESYSVAV
jgi:hypothetical protein